MVVNSKYMFMFLQNNYTFEALSDVFYSEKKYAQYA